MPVVTLPRPALQQIHEVTAGNPFYALELVRSLPREEPRATLQCRRPSKP